MAKNKISVDYQKIIKEKHQRKEGFVMSNRKQIMDSRLLIKNEQDRLNSKNIESPNRIRTKPGILNA